MAKLLRIDGSVEDVEPVNGKRYKEEQLEVIVGGCYDIIHSQVEGDDRVVIVDADGQAKGKYYNRRATSLLLAFGIKDEYIAGNALLCHDYEVIDE